MKFLFMIGSIALPIAMLFINNKFKHAQFLFDVLAFISTIIFGNIAAISIYNVIADDTLFMTTIHSIFLNPFFILTGAYIGLYAVYRLLLCIANEKRSAL